eukprot:10872-Heterococcus_DN1.PRE.1
MSSVAVALPVPLVARHHWICSGFFANACITAAAVSSAGCVSSAHTTAAVCYSRVVFIRALRSHY